MNSLVSTASVTSTASVASLVTIRELDGIHDLIGLHGGRGGPICVISEATWWPRWPDYMKFKKVVMSVDDGTHLRLHTTICNRILVYWSNRVIPLSEKNLAPKYANSFFKGACLKKIYLKKFFKFTYIFWQKKLVQQNWLEKLIIYAKTLIFKATHIVHPNPNSTFKGAHTF